MAIVTFFRSSSYNTWDICPHKYVIGYVLGIREVAGISADKGNCVHKALELLARRKLAMQQNKSYFKDDELGEFSVFEMEPDLAINIAWDYIRKAAPYQAWKEADLKDCTKYMWEALNWKNGMFSPLKREIVSPEQYFEFTIKKPWAAYDYDMPDGSKVSGYLGIKGTMDLIVRQGNNLEMIDWKTGARFDWGSFQDKSYEKLQKDFQLRLYNYAARLLYPKTEHIFTTIFYMKAGGPVSLYYTEHDMQETEDMLKKRFETIRNTKKPSLVYPSRKCNFCHYKKNTIDGKPTEDYNESICNVVRQDIVSLGLDKVMTKYAKPDSFNNYGSGGGKREKE